MDELMCILKELKEDVDFEKETKLVDDEILDSLDIMELISSLEEKYDIIIEMEEIVPENFNSAGAMCKMIQKLGGSI